MARRGAENAGENISFLCYHFLKQIEFPIFEYLTFFRLQALIFKLNCYASKRTVAIVFG